MMMSPWKIYSGLVALLALALAGGAAIIKDASGRALVDAYVLGMDANLPDISDTQLSRMPVADAARIAAIHHGRGQAAAAVDIFARLDALDRLNAEGLRTLAFYQAETHDFRAQNRTLARLAETDLNHTEIRRILGYFDAMGMADDRLALLEILHARGDASPEDRVQLMRIYRHAGRPDDALNVLKDLLSSNIEETSINNMRTLVRLMARSDQAADVPALLNDWISAPVGIAEIRARLSLLAELGESELVVRHAAPWRTNDTLIARLFDYALYTLRDDPEFASGYTDRLLERLADPENRGEAMMAKVHEVFDRLPADDAYDRLRLAAPGDDDVLTQVYLDRLVKEGRIRDAGAIVFARFDAAGNDFDLKRSLAADLVSIGDLNRAETAYKRLARQYGPIRSTMNGLRYVWKQQNEPDDIDWLGAQLLAANPGRYLAWEAEFKASADAGALLDWLQAQPAPRTPSSSLAATRVTLALWEPGAPRLDGELQLALSSTGLTTDQVNTFLTAACENGHVGAVSQALSIYETFASPHAAGRLCLARLTPDDAPSRLALYRYKSAETAGASFSALDMFRYASVTRDALGAQSAAPLYRTALQQLPPLADASIDQARLRGFAEMDLGNRRAAAVAFERVLDSRPGNKDPAVLKLLLQLYTDLGDYSAVLRLTEAFKGAGGLPLRVSATSLN